MANQLTSSWVAQVLQLPTPAPTDFESIVTDSRKIVPGCLFAALPGDQFDGHDFIEAAIAQGARGILCRTDRVPRERKAGTCFFAVEDTLPAYRKIAGAWRGLFSIPLVMVAGSNGKTTTKELLTSLLRGKFSEVHKTQASQNGFVGIPMTLLELRSAHRAAVIEVGIDEPGAMLEHVKTVSPTTSLLTIIGPEHLEKLIDLDTVEREEGLALTLVADEGGSVAINLDDPRIAHHFTEIRSSKKLGYTLKGSPKSDILAGRITEDHRRLEVGGGGFSSPETFELPLPGEHNALNLLAAISAAQLQGLSAEEMRAGLKTFAGAEGRSQIRNLRDGTQVICDYYNSQPASLQVGLALLSQLSSDKKPSWACLADMLELGTHEEQFHREPAKWVQSLGIRNIALFGPRMKWLEDELRKNGFSGFLRHFESQSELASCISKEVLAGSVVLIKGSRSMKMEEVWRLFEQARKQ